MSIAEHRSVAELKTWVAGQIAAYKVRDRWRVMERLPKTSTGKLDRKTLHLNATTEAQGC